ncbi:hypothetical protein B566_EDAN012326, partial [Ephemera danica]
MERWVGRVAIVTGASAGIGADIARLLAENGMRVVGVARRVHRVQELAEEMKGCKGEIHAVHGDVTKEEDVLRVVRWTRDTLGGADVLVNNAGTFFSLPLTGIGADIARLLAENGMRVVGVARRVHRVQELAEEMKGCKGEIHAVHGDVTKEEDVLRVVRWTRDTLGGADVLVNNAGTYFHLPLTDALIISTMERWVGRVAIVTGASAGIGADIARLLAENGMRVVGVARRVHRVQVNLPKVFNELAEEMRGCKGEIHAVHGDVTKEEDVLRVEISPGAVRTEIILASGRTPEEAKKKYDSFGAVMEPRDISNALLYALTVPPHVQVIHFLKHFYISTLTMERWVGRVAIVTGASAGIGADIARLLAENGMRVVGVARRVHRVQELAEEMKGCKGEIHAVHGDVTKEEDVLRVVKWTRDTLGGADVLVNNAGIYYNLPLT